MISANVLDFARFAAIFDPFVMIVDAHRKLALGTFLADDVLIEFRLDLARFGDHKPFRDIVVLDRDAGIFIEDVTANPDADIADINPGPRENFPDVFTLVAPAE